MNFHQKKTRWPRIITFVFGAFIALPVWASCPAVVDANLVTATPGLTLTMTVDKSGAKPGDVLLYTLRYCNASDAGISNLKIDGVTPAFTNFVSASCGETPSDMTCIIDTQPTPGDSGAIVWALTGALQPGASGIVNFKASVH